jgi:hypothetical protein
MIEIKTSYTCEGSSVVNLIATTNGLTEDECHVNCLLDATCFWIDYKVASTNTCSLYKGGCAGVDDNVNSVTAYRPSDFMEPSHTIDTCTHKEIAGRDSTKETTCIGLLTKADCDTDTDCFYNPG